MEKFQVVKETDADSAIAAWFDVVENQLKPFIVGTVDRNAEEWIPLAPMLTMEIASECANGETTPWELFQMCNDFETDKDSKVENLMGPIKKWALLASA